MTATDRPCETCGSPIPTGTEVFIVDDPTSSPVIRLCRNCGEMDVALNKARWDRP